MKLEDLRNVIGSYSYRHHSEKDLQDALEYIFKINKIDFSREYRIDNANILDFLVTIEDQKCGIEVKIGGAQNDLLRQISRYLRSDKIDCIFVVGTPFWVNNLPATLCDKPIYVHRIMRGIF